MSQYRRRIYLVNPSFQLKFSLLITLLVIISSLFYPFTIYELIERYISLVTSTNPEKIIDVKQYKNALIIALALWQVGFSVLVFIICIIFTHKIAGPIYKLQKYLATIREGVTEGKLFFRKGDYFRDLEEDVNETFEAIKENYKRDVVYLSEVNSYLKNLVHVVPEDKRVVLEEINKNLDEIQLRFTKHV